MRMMQRSGAALAATLWLVALPAYPAGAPPVPPTPPAYPTPPSDPAALQRKLDAAQARLEAAAREVAELTSGLITPELMNLQLHFGEPRAMLGLQLGESRSGGGVRVVGVSPGGPAAEAGLKAGDVIVSLNGTRSADATELAEQVRAVKPGDRATLELDRGGKLERLEVAPRVLDPRLMLLHGEHGPGHLFDDGEGMFRHFYQDSAGPWGELELAAVSKGLGRYFGAERGVLVIRAPADGAFNLQDGDLITAIGGREPKGVAHALRILRSYQPGEHLTLAILRDRKAQTLEVTMSAGAGPGPRHRPPPRPMAPPLPLPPSAAAGAAD